VDSGKWIVDRERTVSGGVQDYRELIVWQKAMDLVIEVYRLTRAFPRRTEIFGLAREPKPTARPVGSARV